MIVFALICIYVLYRVFKTHFITPDMTRREKFGAFIDFVSLLILISIAIDIVKNMAGYKKRN
jgi:ethanolamine transporter EutH